VNKFDEVAVSNNWNEHEKLVLHELKRLNDWCEKLDDTLNRKFSATEVSIAQLKIKSGMWGIIGACIPIVIVLFIWLIKSA